MEQGRIPGAELKTLRLEAGLSLQDVAESLLPPASRQYLHRIEGEEEVAANWVGRYIGAIKTCELLRARSANRRLAVGENSVSLAGLDYEPIGAAWSYDEGWATALAWVKAQKGSVVRVSLVVTRWPQTQGVIDCLTSMSIEVVPMDAQNGGLVRRRVSR